MTLLVAGLVVFFAVHAIPHRPLLRARLVEGIGELRYKAAFSVVALAGLSLIVVGMSRAPYVPIWHPPAWSAYLTALAMLPALILLAAANFPNNIKRAARHPMSLGALLWSLGHLLSNGDLASLLLFGGFAAFALFDMGMSKAPAASAPVPRNKDWLAAAIGLGAYVALAALHRTLFGVAAFV